MRFQSTFITLGQGIRSNNNKLKVTHFRKCITEEREMYWANLLHIYQPPGQKREIINEVVFESYKRILDVLETHRQIKISLNICASLTEQLCEFGHQDIITRIKKLAATGQVELVGSAAYHPILPFLPKREIIRQIALNGEINKKYFGSAWQPQGFFLPEMAYSKKVAKIISQNGYQWIVLDEIAYQGNVGQVVFDRIYRLKTSFKKSLKVIFRNRGLSATFFGSWLDVVDKIFRAAEKDGRVNEFLITAFDGENLGHHQARLVGLWEEIALEPRITTINYSQYLEILKKNKSRTEEVKPLNSSWATEREDFEKNNFYPLWSDPHNQIHKKFKRLTNIILKLVYRSAKNENYVVARKILDQALFSDPCWWASARPWWGPEIIERGVEYFSKIVHLLQNKVSPRLEKKVKILFKEIIRAARTRDKSS